MTDPPSAMRTEDHAEPGPVVVAFDGSDPGRAALEQAVALFPTHRLIVATVWEPGLALAVMPASDLAGYSYSGPSVEQIRMVDQANRDHAVAVAEAGVALARNLGATAEPDATRDALNVADTLLALAEQEDAAAIVVGSRGLGATRARLMGSTSRRLLHDARRPVVVVRERERPER
jgi:nucleotide-binding universal stress UspA family protein